MLTDQTINPPVTVLLGYEFFYSPSSILEVDLSTVAKFKSEIHNTGEGNYSFAYVDLPSGCKHPILRNQENFLNVLQGLGVAFRAGMYLIDYNLPEGLKQLNDLISASDIVFIPCIYTLALTYRNKLVKTSRINMMDCLIHLMRNINPYSFELFENIVEAVEEAHG